MSFAITGIAAFFTIMTVAEGGGRRAVQTKLRDMYVPTIKANYMVWPLVQIVNFRLMPVQFQLVSPCVGDIRRAQSPLPPPRYPETQSAYAHVLLAIRLHGRYRLDCLPLSHERRRGCPADQDPRPRLSYHPA